jgi:hypothetical protein
MEELGWMSTGGLVVIGAGLTVLAVFLVPCHGFGFTIFRFHEIKPAYFRRVFYWLAGFGVLFLIWQLPALFFSTEENDTFLRGLLDDLFSESWVGALLGFGLTIQIHVVMYLVMYWFSTVKGNAAASFKPLITPLTLPYLLSSVWFVASDAVQSLLD